MDVEDDVFKDVDVEDEFFEGVDVDAVNVPLGMTIRFYIELCKMFLRMNQYQNQYQYQIKILFLLLILKKQV